MSVQFEFFWGRTHIDRSSFYHLVLNFSFWDRTYIDRLFSCRFEFESRLHLYQSVIFLSVCIWFELGRIYIDRSLSCQFSFELGPHLYRSIICLVNLSSSWVFGPHLYRLVIVMLVQFQVGTAPISINQHHVVWVFGTVSILIGHSPCVQFKFWDRTYIDRSSSISAWVWVFSVDHTYTISHTFVSSVLSST